MHRLSPDPVAQYKCFVVVFAAAVVYVLLIVAAGRCRGQLTRHKIVSNLYEEKNVGGICTNEKQRTH